MPSSNTTYSVEDRDFLGFPSPCQIQLRLRRASSATSTSDEAGRPARYIIAAALGYPQGKQARGIAFAREGLAVCK